MVGLVVTPTTWLPAIRSARLPETRRARLRSSSQIATPASVSSVRWSPMDTPHDAAPPGGEREELGTRPVVLPQRAEQGGRDRAAPGRPHSAQAHAHVLGLGHDADARWAQVLL